MINFKDIVNKNLLKYLSVSYFNVIFNVVLNLLLLNRLSTVDFGKFSLGKTIFQSFDFAHLGIRNAFDRIFPDEKDQIRILNLFSTGLIFNFIVSFLLIMFWFYERDDDKIFYLLFSIAGLLSSIIMLFRIYYRSFENKDIFVSLSAVSILLPSLAQLVGFLIYGFWGLVIGFISSYLYLLLHIFIKYRPVLNFSISLNNLKLLFNKGFLLFLSSLLAFVSLSGDRFLIEKFWNIQAVGNFSAILFFFSVFTIFSVNYTEMIMSKLIAEKSLKLVIRHSLILLGLSATMVVFANLLLPIVIKTFMSKYYSEINNIRLITLGILPFSIRSILYFYLHGIDKRKFLLLADLISTLLYFVCLFIVLKNTVSMREIVVVKLAYYFFNVGFIIIYIFTKKSKIESTNETVF